MDWKGVGDRAPRFVYLHLAGELLEVLELLVDVLKGHLDFVLTVRVALELVEQALKLGGELVEDHLQRLRLVSLLRLVSIEDALNTLRDEGLLQNTEGRIKFSH